MTPQEKKDLYQKVFSSKNGKKVLMDLCKSHYIYETTYSTKNTDTVAFVREGERRVVIRILEFLKKET